MENNIIFNQNLDTWPKVEIEGGLRLKGIYKSQKNKPLITVITAVYNSDKYLEECLNSLYSQKSKNFEHIVVDGGSNENTIQILKKFDDKIECTSDLLIKSSLN